MKTSELILLQVHFSNILGIIEDSEREGTQATPARAAKAFADYFSGYDKEAEIESMMTIFSDGAEDYHGMVVIKDLPFYSHCEHHIAPFFGTATIGYIPNGKIVGLSKLGRLLDIYSKRLQVQERLTNQIVQAMDKYLSPIGCGCIIKARHLCMESRGLCKTGQETTTSVLSGAFLTSARLEFLEFLK